MYFFLGALFAFLLAAEPSYALWAGPTVSSPAPPVPPHVLILSGILMMSVAGASVSLWQYWTSTKRKWFLFGAFVWFVGVVLKIIWGQFLSAPILGWLIDNLPAQLFLFVGSLYIGVLTGIFEIGITALLAIFWKESYEKFDRAVAVGIGAGATEAYLIGAFVLFLGPVISQSHICNTPFLWLVGPVERVIAILCHAASRAFVLLALRTGERKHFWTAFWLMTLLDAVAGFFHLSGYVDEISPWLMECALVPFAIASCILIDRCRSLWPEEA